MTILTRRKERIPIPARPQFEGTYYRYAVRAAARQLQNMSFPPLLPCLPGRCRCVFLRQCVTPSPFLPSFLLHLEFNALSSAAAAAVAAVSPSLPPSLLSFPLSRLDPSLCARVDGTPAALAPSVRPTCRSSSSSHFFQEHFIILPNDQQGGTEGRREGGPPKGVQCSLSHSTTLIPTLKSSAAG